VPFPGFTLGALNGYAHLTLFTSRTAGRNGATGTFGFFAALDLTSEKHASPSILTQPREAAMLELVFTVCSIVQGAGCRELNPMPLQENTHMIACLMASQIEGARWVEAHPNFYIARSKCQPARTFAIL
jgi:hypothetical protein